MVWTTKRLRTNRKKSRKKNKRVQEILGCSPVTKGLRANETRKGEKGCASSTEKKRKDYGPKPIELADVGWNSQAWESPEP